MERSERTAEAAGLTSVRVDNPRGRVDVGPSPDGRLHIVATKVVRMATSGERRRYAEQTRVATSSRDGRYSITVTYPRRVESHVDFWDLFSESGRRKLRLPSLEVRIELQVPPGLELDLQSRSGDLSTQDVSAGQTLESTSGDIDVSRARGMVSIESTSGDVTADDAANLRIRTTSGDVTVARAGTLDVESTSGDIAVDRASDGLAIGTTSGDIRVADAARGIRAHTVSGELVVEGACERVDMETRSGDIQARLRAPLREVRCSSVSGDVEVELASGVGASVTARSTSGSIDCRIPAVVLKHDRNSLDAKVGSGGVPIRLTTTSGNVTLSSGGK